MYLSLGDVAPSVVTLAQPNGYSFQATQYGSKWTTSGSSGIAIAHATTYTDPTGRFYVIRQNPSGWWVFMKVVGGNIVGSGSRVAVDPPPTAVTQIVGSGSYPLVVASADMLQVPSSPVPNPIYVAFEPMTTVQQPTYTPVQTPYPATPKPAQRVVVQQTDTMGKLLKNWPILAGAGALLLVVGVLVLKK